MGSICLIHDGPIMYDCGRAAHSLHQSEASPSSFVEYVGIREIPPIEYPEGRCMGGINMFNT